MLQAMHSVKFSGNPSHYRTFRERLRDNLEDEMLSDGQKLEFLPKFVTIELLSCRFVLSAQGAPSQNPLTMT